MAQINIRRDSSGKVTFDTVSIDTTENVFFTNLDPKSEHWPAFPPTPPATQFQPFTTNKLGPCQSPNSSQCTVPAADPPLDTFQVFYGCQIKGHEAEQGVINVFSPLAAATTTLDDATKGQEIDAQQVVQGGMSPYRISGQQFQITDQSGAVIKSGQGIGPGLQLDASTDSNGISVTGTPTMSGTYLFTFNVDDAMGKNLQQVQYTMNVT